MPGLSQVDHSVSPPRITIPREFNLAHDLVERNLAAGRGTKIAFIDDAGSYTYDELAVRVNQAANALIALGLRMEDRVMLCHLDTIDWVAVFLGAIKAGIVPLATNTMFTTKDYGVLLDDSRARALIVSEVLLPAFAPVLESRRFLEHVIVSGAEAKGHAHLQSLTLHAGSSFEAVPTTGDDVCFWLFSSGSTGTPKGTLHLHSSLIHCAELYGRGILRVRESDVLFSAAKLFFAYGLGNSLGFVMAAGATTILMAERPTPQAVFKRLREGRPTVFYGVPTLYSALLASPELPKRGELALRVCTSAGEALPAELGERWSKHLGVEVLDGIGSTEMLHIFMSNRPGAVRYGTSGTPVPGYAVKVVGEDGQDCGPGEIGDLYINGPSSAASYWNNREKSLATFLGPWTRSGDKYTYDEHGVYTYAGRSDDMLKVSGQYVSPFEVEAALLTHPSVLEAAVVGHDDEAGLLKPKAFIALKPQIVGTDALAAELQQHVRARLAAHKYPRWIEFVTELPKTATGKIQRFKLRIAR